MRTYNAVMINGETRGVRAYSEEGALRAAIAIFGDDAIDHIEVV